MHNGAELAQLVSLSTRRARAPRTRAGTSGPLRARGAVGQPRRHRHRRRGRHPRPAGAAGGRSPARCGCASRRTIRACHPPGSAGAVQHGAPRSPGAHRLRAGRANPSPRGPPVSIVVSPSPRQRWRTTPWPIPTPAPDAPPERRHRRSERKRRRIRRVVAVVAAVAVSVAFVLLATDMVRFSGDEQPSLAGTIHAGGGRGWSGHRHHHRDGTRLPHAVDDRSAARCGSGATRSPGRSAPRSARSPAPPASCSPTSTRGCRAASRPRLLRLARPRHHRDGPAQPRGRGVHHRHQRLDRSQR